MPRKPSFDIVLAIELFKSGSTVEDISKELHIKADTLRKAIKRNSAEIEKNPLNKYEVISLFESGLNYAQIAEKLNSNPDAVRMIIVRNAPDLLEAPVDKSKVIELFRCGKNLKQIAVDLSSNVPNIRKILERNVPEELKKRMKEKAAERVDMKLFEPHEEDLDLEVTGALSVEDRKQLLDEKSWGINQNEGLSDYSFFQSNRQSFISDKKNNRKYKFDERRGHIQKDLKILNL